MGLFQFVTLLGIAILASLVLARRRPAWNLSFLVLFSIVWIGSAGYYQTRTGRVAKTALLNGYSEGSIYGGDEAGAWSIFALFVIGVISGVITAVLYERTYRRGEGHLANRFEESAVQQRSVTLLVASSVVSVALLGFALLTSGYPSNREQMSVLLSEIPDGGSFVGEAIVRVCVQGPCFAVLLLRIGKPRTVTPVAAFVSICLWLLWSNPVVTARYWSFGSLIAFGLMAIAVRHKQYLDRLSNISVVFLLPLLAVVIFPLLDRFRTDSTTTGSFSGLEETLVSDPDFDAFAQAGNVFVVVDREGLTYGTQVLSPLTVPVPRSIWAGKPVSGGEYVSRSLDTDHPNVGLPLPAELYLDFGLSGALIAGALCGVTVERLDLNLASRHRTPRQLALAIGFAPFWVIMLRGSLLPVAYRMVPLLIIFFFLTPTVQRYPIKQVRKQHVFSGGAGDGY